MEANGWMVSCPKYGGTRDGRSCAHFDRYRTCRRNCLPLERLMGNNPGLREAVLEEYANREVHQPCRYSCMGLPYHEFRCKICRFIAKSQRGLSRHHKRAHTDKGLY